MNRSVIDLDAVELAALTRAGEFSAREVAEAYLERIAARDPMVQAWAYLDPDAVRAEADALDASASKGPLHGVPVGIKDVIATHDMPTANGSPLYAGHRVAADAAIVRLLRQAGALIIGKTHTVELASVGQPPPTRNPHAPDHTPGGSSSGSAAAVADRQAPLAIGTQTGGSIIRPASYCGLWAIKPSWGSVSTEGVKPFAPSLDTLGWFGCSARDLALLLDIVEPTPAAPTTVQLAGARIGLWRTSGWDRAEADTRHVIDCVVERFRAAGARVAPFEFDSTRLAADHLAIMYAEGQRSFLADYRRDASLLHPRIAEMVRTAAGVTATELRAAHDRAAEARVAFDAHAARHDAILSPSTPGAAPMGLDYTGDLIFNGLITLLHAPAVNLPLWRTAEGLPVGVTLTGRRGADRKLLALAERLQLIEISA